MKAVNHLDSSYIHRFHPHSSLLSVKALSCSLCAQLSNIPACLCLPARLKLSAWQQSCLWPLAVSRASSGIRFSIILLLIVRGTHRSHTIADETEEKSLSCGREQMTRTGSPSSISYLFASNYPSLSNLLFAYSPSPSSPFPFFSTHPFVLQSAHTSLSVLTQCRS